jgi:hypothetical protein
MAEEAGLATRVLESHDLPGSGCWRAFCAGPPIVTRKARRAMRHLRHGGAVGPTALPDDAIPEGPVAGPLLLAAPLILFAREQGT